MGRYTGPICRLCRREGVKLCDKHKCASVRRNYPPGMHGKDSHGKKSDYAKQLREKQKARRIFGVSEKQIQRYYKKAVASMEESGTELIRQMEHRLDNAIFRCGFASTRRQARQLVAHGIFTLNGKRINIPSVPLKEGDSFTVRTKNKSMPLFEHFAQKKITPPKWLKIDVANLNGQVISKAQKEDLEGSIAPEMIIEFYSR
ncbi:30S ribosomal protein S4 [Candidatus Peregrinibacteria bacterium]|nr:30S ribosomal protein S4 [Candidatus Peregrinibacteria bacterium]